MADNILDVEEGAKTSLICEDNQEFRNTITSVLKELKYETDTAANADEAFEKLRFNRYDVVAISEKYAGSAPENNELLKHLQTMPMSNRRHIFVALFGEDLVTGDNMQAFDKSVNVVINEKDLPTLKTVLKRSISDNDQFYKVYKESLIKMGKR